MSEITGPEADKSSGKESGLRGAEPSWAEERPRSRTLPELRAGLLWPGGKLQPTPSRLALGPRLGPPDFHGRSWEK